MVPLFQCEKYYTEVGRQTFLKVHKSQIRKFLGSFRYPKSANFFVVSVRKSAFFYDYQLLTNSKISNKNSTTLSQNSFLPKEFAGIVTFWSPLLSLSCFMDRVQAHVLIGHRQCV